jgi:hypothetical protein
MPESRARAWRRFKRRIKLQKKYGWVERPQSSEKKWRLMYSRSEKLRRARQLGIEYPKRTVRQILDEEQPRKY